MCGQFMQGEMMFRFTHWPIQWIAFQTVWRFHWAFAIFFLSSSPALDKWAYSPLIINIWSSLHPNCRFWIQQNIKYKRKEKIVSNSIPFVSGSEWNTSWSIGALHQWTQPCIPLLDCSNLFTSHWGNRLTLWTNIVDIHTQTNKQKMENKGESWKKYTFKNSIAQVRGSNHNKPMESYREKKWQTYI